MAKLNFYNYFYVDWRYYARLHKHAFIYTYHLIG